MDTVMNPIPAPGPRISVVICTWNRGRLLRKTLEQMTRLIIPPGAVWELVVVNNNSSDDTDSVLREFEGKLPVVRLFEPTAGKSYAANLAVREAKGEYIVWTDDDVLVEPDWLQAYVTAFAMWPDASVFGGAIDPWFEQTPPRWLEEVFRQVEEAYAALDYGPTGLAMTHESYPFGANMALKRSAHLMQPFDTRLGPRPKSGIRGEETFLVERLFSLGHTGRWVPEARVRHLIPAERHTLKYLEEYYSGFGEFLGVMTRNNSAGVRVFGRPLWLWKETLLSEVGYRLSRLSQPPTKWILEFKRAKLARGRLRIPVSGPSSHVRVADHSVGSA
ncbi:MAG: glycosyl transferase family 2 [Gemmatimonadales bacterium]|jgi:GT2 family glycosyltransferase|nr:glycosyl transferase family 2 [Gemmatimonadales bacterium]